MAILATSAHAKPETRNRAEIPEQYRWDFTPIYANWEAWDEGMKAMEAKMDEFAALKGSLAGGPAAVQKAYLLYDEIGMLQYRVYRYPQLQRDVDTRDQTIAGKFQRVGAVFAKFGTATAWFQPELLTIPQEKMEHWIKDTPELEPYAFTILDTYRQQKHVLDEKGEQLLSYGARFNQTPNSIYQELSTSDIKFPAIKLADGSEVVVSPANYGAILETNRNQADRAAAFEAHLKTYSANANTYAAIYNSVLQRGWAGAQSRSYPTTLAASLDNSAIPAGVVETLVETTRAGTAPLQRYMRLRQKILGLAEHHFYDGAVAIFESTATYPYDTAKDTVIASVAPLGADYTAKYLQFVSGGRIDVYENEGKRSGAYCAGVYGVGPYLLMNYNDTLDAIFTLAHEAGHGMHTVLSYESQPFVNSSYTIFVAEVASTINERFLLEHMLARTDDAKERFLLLQHAVDSIRNTFYTQVLFADFELQAHKLAESGQPITAEVLSGIYLKLLQEYYGDSVTIDELYKYTWARIPHFYNTPYYVYQYATCFASSAQLFKEMTTGDEASRAEATERYLTLLRSGGNDHPMKQLQKAGVDLSKRETVQAVVDQMDELVTRMENEAAKITGD
ncbi:MAG TPA: oligoendopeptidase F [Opitutaceae bacterium]|nr:oligoendopeptidase F [Opitutaceae bacterium]